MLTIKTYLSPSQNKGIGLFSEQTIKKGEVIWIEHPMFFKEIPKEELEKLDTVQQDYFKKYATFYKDSNSYYLDLDDTRFINHSFEPNMEFVDDIGIAIRDINCDEEIFCDYVKLNPINAELEFCKRKQLNHSVHKYIDNIREYVISKMDISESIRKIISPPISDNM